MANGHSIHIGLNLVDPAHYNGWNGQLAACEFDAKDMLALAKKQGFATSESFLTKNATSTNVIAALNAAAKKLVSGDILFLSYSGHGGQVPDANNDEAVDQQDETWVLYDRQLVDDELFALYAKFKAGVRIMVLSDSCHSGTVTRAMPNESFGVTRNRLMPPAIGKETFKANKALYNEIQKANPAAETIKVKATVLLISGCTDNQLSADGDRNGLFTEKLKKVWNGGRFNGSTKKLRDLVAAQMPAIQSPQYSRVGAANAAFEAQKPFTV